MPSKTLGVWSGVGLVVANMVGAGVFLSTGFMAQSLSAGLILLAWLVGGILAMAGARSYAEVARLVPQGGGEYRYLSTLMHPALGYLAGWASLLVGFSMPIAIDGLAAGAFVRTIFPSVSAQVIAVVLIISLTALHAIGLKSSARMQNALVAIKVLLLVGFVLVGVTQGSLSWPTWQPANTPASVPAEFVSSLFYIAFAYSGWNAAIYASDEFKNPERDVPRAMLLGCLAVMALYLVVNFIFVANLNPGQLSVVFKYSDFTSPLAPPEIDTSWQQVTLGQAVMARLLSAKAAQVMSGVMVLLFMSAMSAMTLVGPRVTMAMARDGFLPKQLVPADGKPPLVALLLQAVLAIVVVLAHDLRSALESVGAILTFFAALTVAGLFRAALRAKTSEEKPALTSLLAAGLYVVSAAVMLYFGFREKLGPAVWLAAIAAATVAAWFVTNRFRKETT